jgi:hypothetical protein
MSSEETVHVFLTEVTPRSGKETLGTWSLRRGPGLIKPGTSNRSQGQGRSDEQTGRRRGVCEPALELRGNLGRLISEMPELLTGPEKFGRPAL